MKFRSLPILLILLFFSLVARVNNFSMQIYYDNKQKNIIKIHSFLIEEAQANESHAENKLPTKNEKTEHTESTDHNDKSSSKNNSTHPAEQLQPTVEDQKFLNLTCNPQLNEYSPEAIKLLQNLTQRRKELEARADEIKLKEQLLQATELQMNDKITALKDLKLQVENLLSQYDEKENQKILSLVKIYEAMKPVDAAKIFDSLDMTVLLQVINQMKETKVALVLAKMNVTKAQEISTEYANQKKISNLTR